ncbi:MAG: siderophore ABC transporter substrate-binding protein [Paracoccus sp. (in: a-proteobacteria)]|uniref:siderophore ABC transporter substrate-binding protein n=1 Tax=Paracoccus sp. TaxID=267 RepID=UPI0026DEF6F3|nr:siderophore ABC transporter substrate-binding protein [Paracoccus sp. (in: a-proteobacteria)]MDO5632757.1 siderophore ABC transporter substrate-binding protein [Paracoccus sp. (in: a-proteobacteria)]
MLSTLAAIALAAPVLAEDVTIATAQGDVTLPANPATVAVYDIAALDSLTALGVPVQGVPDNLYLPALKDSVAAAPVGTLFEPDLEKLAALNPDLIIVAGRSATQKQAVERIAPTIDMTLGTDVLAAAKDRITAYGTLFSRQDRAAELNAELDDKITTLHAAAEGKGTALVIMTNGPKMAAYGEGSRFGWLHAVTGMPQAIASLDPTANHGSALSPELIADANPDWLFVMDRGAAIGETGQSAQATLDMPLIHGTSAWSKGQVVYLPSTEIYIAAGGYHALNTVIDNLTEALTK